MWITAGGEIDRSARGVKKRLHRGKFGMFHHLQCRPYGLTENAKLYDAARGSADFMKRLTLDKKLEVHNGCVNTISWNESGTKILSGSDDQYLVITNPYTGQVLHKIRSGHRSNIFSAKFLPNSHDGEIVSCSGDGKIYYTIVDREETHGTFLFDCHNVGTAYEVIVVPNEASTFLSCGEDGTVRFFDLRAKTSCTKSDCKEDVLISCRCAITSLSANPVLPWQLAVGCSDSTVRIYDRRLLSTRASGNYTGKGITGLISIFTPPSLEEQSYRITSLNFSPDGEDVLVSYSSEYIYLFGTKDSGKSSPLPEETSNSDLTKDNARGSQENESSAGAVGGDDSTSHPDPLLNHPGPSTSTDDRQPPLKRLRLRGDWSDTGPGARPESERRARASRSSATEGNQPGDPAPRPSIMQRMSDLLTNWLDSNLHNLPEAGESPSAGAAENNTDSTTDTAQNLSTDRNDSQTVAESEAQSSEMLGTQSSEMVGTQSSGMLGRQFSEPAMAQSASQSGTGREEQMDEMSETQSGESSATRSAFTFRTPLDAMLESHAEEQASTGEGLLSPVSSDTSPPDVRGVEDSHLSFLHKIESMDMRDNEHMGETSTVTGAGKIQPGTSGVGKIQPHTSRVGAIKPGTIGTDEIKDEPTLGADNVGEIPGADSVGASFHASSVGGADICDSVQTNKPSTAVTHSKFSFGTPVPVSKGHIELPDSLQPEFYTEAATCSQTEYDPLQPTVYSESVESRVSDESEQVKDHFTDIRECFKSDDNKPGTSGLAASSADIEGTSNSSESVSNSSVPMQSHSVESNSSGQSDTSSKSPIEDRYVEDRSAIRMSMNAALESLRARNVEPVISLHYSSEGTSNSTIRLGFTSFQSLEAEIAERRLARINSRNNREANDGDTSDSDASIHPDDDPDESTTASQEVSDSTSALDLSQAGATKMESDTESMEVSEHQCEHIDESQTPSGSTIGAGMFKKVDDNKPGTSGLQTVSSNTSDRASIDTNVTHASSESEQNSVSDSMKHASSDNTCDMLDVSNEASVGLTPVRTSDGRPCDDRPCDDHQLGEMADEDDDMANAERPRSVGTASAERSHSYGSVNVGRPRSDGPASAERPHSDGPARAERPHSGGGSASTERSGSDGPASTERPRSDDPASTERLRSITITTGRRSREIMLDPTVHRPPLTRRPATGIGRSLAPLGRVLAPVVGRSPAPDRRSESVEGPVEPGRANERQLESVVGTSGVMTAVLDDVSSTGLAANRSEDMETADEAPRPGQRDESGTATRGRRRRVGFSGPPTGDFQLPSFSGSTHNSSSSSEDESRERVEEDRRPRIDRTTAALRLQALHRKRQEAREKKEIETKNIYKPTVKKRYKGHRNARTMIKEANFWGNNFVMSGSDCGHIFIWDRHTAEMVMLLEGDRHVVNCVQPHPVDTVLASSGIDYDIKIWAPLLHKSGYDEERAMEVIHRNEVMLDETRDTITVPAAFMLRVLASINNIRSGRRAAVDRNPEPGADNTSDSD